MNMAILHEPLCAEGADRTKSAVIANPAIGAFAEGLGPSVPDVWAEYNALTDKHYAPGEFVTIHAYECSLEAPYGHHNVFFRSKPGPLLPQGDLSLPDVWKALKAGEALTIPHQTGKMPFPIFGSLTILNSIGILRSTPRMD
jgi:hypothetical protein